MPPWGWKWTSKPEKGIQKVHDNEGSAVYGRGLGVSELPRKITFIEPVLSPGHCVRMYFTGIVACISIHNVNITVQQSCKMLTSKQSCCVTNIVATL